MKKQVKNQPDQQAYEDMQNKYLRAIADYQNLEKRVAVTLDQARIASRKEVVAKFIGILDDLEKAEIFVQDAGLRMIMDRFNALLTECGVSEIDVLGKEYDPYVAEALEMVPGDTPHKVAEVVRKGYRIGDSIIRPAQVKVTQ